MGGAYNSDKGATTIMAQFSLAAQPRTVTGKKTRFLRRAGAIPANIYGHNFPSQAVQVPTEALTSLLLRANSTSLVNLRVAGAAGPVMVMLRDVQREPRTGSLIHVDFYVVQMGESTRVEVPIHAVGVAPAVRNLGATLVQSMRSVEVEALPNLLPSAIEVDVSGLTELHDTVYVRDLKVGRGVVVHAPADEPVFSAAPTRTEAENAEGVTAEPQRVTRERSED